MAPKCRNMFYQNKKQETTEIDLGVSPTTVTDWAESVRETVVDGESEVPRRLLFWSSLRRDGPKESASFQYSPTIYTLRANKEGVQQQVAAGASAGDTFSGDKAGGSGPRIVYNAQLKQNEEQGPALAEITDVTKPLGHDGPALAEITDVTKPLDHDGRAGAGIKDETEVLGQDGPALAEITEVTKPLGHDGPALAEITDVTKPLGHDGPALAEMTDVTKPLDHDGPALAEITDVTKPLGHDGPALAEMTDVTKPLDHDGPALAEMTDVTKPLDHDGPALAEITDVTKPLGHDGRRQPEYNRGGGRCDRGRGGRGRFPRLGEVVFFDPRDRREKFVPPFPWANGGVEVNQQANMNCYPTPTDSRSSLNRYMRYSPTESESSSFVGSATGNQMHAPMPDASYRGATGGALRYRSPEHTWSEVPPFRGLDHWPLMLTRHGEEKSNGPDKIEPATTNPERKTQFTLNPDAVEFTPGGNGRRDIKDVNQETDATTSKNTTKNRKPVDACNSLVWVPCHSHVDEQAKVADTASGRDWNAIKIDGSVSTADDGDWPKPTFSKRNTSFL
ncbi:hypothetical protein AAG570_008190 [Ranatra chinensis]|uniref:Uncharacterized protein n=1 Tax=Ranatra chinensis TaxID=642074 RepID=A0ABD0Y7T2_9HEMI